MAIDFDGVEAAQAKAREKRQDKQVPLLIRDDGLLMPNVPLIRKKGNFYPYTGNPKATLQQRLEYVANIGKGARRKVVYEEPAPFDLGNADADDIVAFAWEEYSVVLDGTLALPELRKLCFAVSNMSESELNSYRLGKRPAPPEAQSAGLGLNVPSVGDITAPPKPAPAAKTPKARSGGRGHAGSTAEA